MFHTIYYFYLGVHIVDKLVEFLVLCTKTEIKERNSLHGYKLYLICDFGEISTGKTTARWRYWLDERPLGKSFSSGGGVTPVPIQQRPFPYVHPQSLQLGSTLSPKNQGQRKKGKKRRKSNETVSSDGIAGLASKRQKGVKSIVGSIHPQSGQLGSISTTSGTAETQNLATPVSAQNFEPEKTPVSPTEQESLSEQVASDDNGENYENNMKRLVPVHFDNPESDSPLPAEPVFRQPENPVNGDSPTTSMADQLLQDLADLLGDPYFYLSDVTS